MSFVNYVKKTPVVQICADWKEYKFLKKLLNEKTFCRDKYFADVQQLTDNVVCMKSEKAENQVMTHYCNKFFQRECNPNCPKAVSHDLYWKFNEDRDNVSLDVLTFWHNKFQNVK